MAKVTIEIENDALAHCETLTPGVIGVSDFAPQTPTIGRMVHYFPTDQEQGCNNGTSPIAAVVVAIWGPECVNLKLHTDSPYDVWKPSVLRGEQPGQWNWPERA